MKDIPRNELLDKLAAGWKVRTKAYGKNTLNNLEELQGIDLKCLIEDDWEGEPPEAKCLSGKLYMVTAFALLQDGKARFIRRPSWDKGKAFKHSVMCFALNYEDIQTSDWEVWG